MLRSLKRTETKKGGASASPVLNESGLTPIGEVTAALFGLPAPAVAAPYRMGGYRHPVYGPCTRFGLTDKGREHLEALSDREGGAL